MSLGALTEHDLNVLAARGWDARTKSRILGSTAVGCVAVGKSGRWWPGCNVEHQFRSHDIHAETNAISNMIVSGEQELVAVVIVAERDRFTPCGACLDWILEFGGPECVVAVQRKRDSPLEVFTAGQLMPHYPR